MEDSTLSETMMNEAALRGNLLAQPHIRATAICLFRHGERILVAEGYDPNKQKTFYRPLGGGIEFGERGCDTVMRELKEEIEADIAPQSLRYLCTIENIFTYNGQVGHELVLLYDGEFTDPAVYEQEEVTATEDDGIPFRAVWKSLDEFGPDAPLYPDGLLEMLRGGVINKNVFLTERK